MKDLLGNEIVVGSVLAYGVRVKNSGGLHFGLVHSVNKRTNKIGILPILKQNTTWRAGKKCMITSETPKTVVSTEVIKDKKFDKALRAGIQHVLSQD